MSTDLNREALFAAPPVAVAALTLNEWVMVATLVYIAAQIAYLAWRWRRDWLKARRENP